MNPGSPLFRTICILPGPAGVGAVPEPSAEVAVLGRHEGGVGGEFVEHRPGGEHIVQQRITCIAGCRRS